mgnify:CR=1 FL=1
MKSISVTLGWFLCTQMAIAQQLPKDSLVYDNHMATKQDLDGWVMEGDGVVEFKDGWMQMYSPNE